MKGIVYIDPEFADALKAIPQDTDHELDLSADIALRILEILERKKMSQTEFAKAMGKKDSEISRWLGGCHNFTIATIARIETTLGEDIISVKRYRKTVRGYGQIPEARKQWLSERDSSTYEKNKASKID